MKRICFCALSALLLTASTFLLSCKKKDDPAPTTPSPTAPSAQEYLTGSGTIKYWQIVALNRRSSSTFNNLYVTMSACVIDNYLVFFNDGDYEERAFGVACNATERLIANSNRWYIDGTTLKVGPFYGFSSTEISTTLFGSDVTIKELNATRFKGERVSAPGDTIRFTLTAVPL